MTQDCASKEGMHKTMKKGSQQKHESIGDSESGLEVMVVPKQ